MVTVVDTKTGKTKAMPERFARILVKLGKVSYLTADTSDSGALAAGAAPAKAKRAYKRRDMQAENT